MTKAFFQPGSFFKLLKLAVLGACLASPIAAQDNAEIVFWQTVSESGSVAQLQAYIDAFPEGIYRPLAEIQIKEIQGAAVAEINATNTQSQEDCDRLAGHSGDETLPVAPTSLSDLQNHVQAAIDACKIAQRTSENPRYAFQLARSYWASGDATNAWNWYLHASLSGHQRATYRLALTLYNGNASASPDLPKIPVDINIPEALEKFKENAERGHLGSAYHAGWILANGEATGTSDFEAAYPYFVQVDQAGLTDAKFALGYMYEHGLQVRSSDDNAIEYYKAAIDSQARHWTDARVRLAHIMLERYGNTIFYKIANPAEYLNELLDLFAASRTDNDVVSHDNYVFIIQREIASISYVVANAAYEFDKDPDVENADQLRLIDSLYARLEPAMVDRHTAFPDTYPNHTWDRANELAHAFWQANKNAIYESHRLRKFKDFASETPADGCVSIDQSSANLTARATVANNCPYEVDFKYHQSIDYYDASLADQSESFESLIGSGATRTYTTSLDHDADAAWQVHWKACYALQGYSEQNWSDLSFYCGEFQRHTYPQYQAMEAEIKRLQEEIFGYAIN